MLTVPAHACSDTCYVLLPPGEYWRQLLIYPADGATAEGVALRPGAYACLLWLELTGGKVWSLTFWHDRTALPARELALIAQRLEPAQLDDQSAVLTHLAHLFNWHGVHGPDPQAAETIAEEIAGRELADELAPYAKGGLASHVLSRYEEGFRAFNAALDKEALELTSAGMLREIDDLRVYNSLMAPLAKIRTYRRQALRAVPLLREPLTSNSAAFRVRRLQQCVDAGNPLLPMLSDYFHAPLPVVEFLFDKDFSLVGDAWRTELDQLVDILTRVRPERWPQGAKDWLQFTELILPICRAMADLGRREYPENLSRCLDDLAREGFARLPTRMRRYGISLEDIVAIPDFEKALYAWAGEAGVDRNRANEALWRYSIFRIAILSRRWRHWLQQEQSLGPEDRTDLEAEPSRAPQGAEGFSELLRGYPYLEALTEITSIPESSQVKGCPIS